MAVIVVNAFLMFTNTTNATRKNDMNMETIHTEESDDGNNQTNDECQKNSSSSSEWDC